MKQCIVKQFFYLFTLPAFNYITKLIEARYLCKCISIQYSLGKRLHTYYIYESMKSQNSEVTPCFVIVKLNYFILTGTGN